MWLNTGTHCPDRLWKLQPCQNPKAQLDPVKNLLWVTLLGAGGWDGGSPGASPASGFQWFHQAGTVRASPGNIPANLGCFGLAWPSMGTPCRPWSCSSFMDSLVGSWFLEKALLLAFMVFKKLLLVSTFWLYHGWVLCSFLFFLIWTQLPLSEECNFTPNNLHYSAI